LGTGASRTTDINLMSGASSTGTVNIASGSTAGAVNIATAGSGNATVNIGSGGTTGNVTIGSTSNTTAISSPLTYASTIGSSYSSLPTRVPASIGYIYAGSFTTLPSSGSSVSNFSITNGGVYVISFAIYITTTTNPTSFFTSLTGGLVNGTTYGYSTINVGNVVSSGTQIITQSTGTSTTYSVTVNYAGGTVLALSTGNSYFKAVKIA
jgi:hypothetical protein